MSNKYLWGKGNDWTFDTLEKTYEALEKINEDKFQLDTYFNQIEVISAEQMLDAYSSTGMPVMYPHWSFGKEYVKNWQNYKRGFMGLAYEIVINSDPCIAYCMEENTATMQALVIAHACFGHNSFFKGNYLFQQHTDASFIIDYLLFAKRYISHCEEKYGEAAVEELIDSCHSLMSYGIDRYKKPLKMSMTEEKLRQKDREEYYHSRLSDLWRDTESTKKEKKKKLPEEPTENILYFIEKNSPVLEDWQREVIRIIRKIGLYYYPQRQTQVMNEGWASFWHYTLMYELYNQNYISDGNQLEFFKSHAGVINQYDWTKVGMQLNVYTLGFNMFRDIKRICQKPTEEDKHWFPEIANTPWLETFKWIMQNFRDESFILNFLSPKVIRDLGLMSIKTNPNNSQNYIVSDISDDNGYREIRKALALQYDLSGRDPDIEVVNVDVDTDRTIHLLHKRYEEVTLHEDTHEVLKHIRKLWGFDVSLVSENAKGDKSNWRSSK